jgi:hypothetical protein
MQIDTLMPRSRDALQNTFFLAWNGSTFLLPPDYPSRRQKGARAVQNSLQRLEENVCFEKQLHGQPNNCATLTLMFKHDTSMWGLFNVMVAHMR